MSQEQWEAMVKQFNRAGKPLSYIVGLLESKVVAVDNQLSNKESLYDKARADLYTAALLAERAVLMELHNLLTTTIDVDQTRK